MSTSTSLLAPIVFEDLKFKGLNALLKTKAYAQVVILCDENTLQFCLPQLVSACKILQTAEIIEVEVGEQSKSLEIAAHLWQSLLDQKAGRNTLLLCLGGGVIGDLGGFCASVYKRGIDVALVPTTLLAMADASVGGKTAIDFAGVKNTIGSFYAPVSVFVCREFLKTLPDRHLMNGLAEIYKIALVADAKLWDKLAELKLGPMLERSIVLKQNIVRKDPLEKGLRKILNFGHTIGHAIEALALHKGADVLHGEAIVAGMIIETHLAWQKKLISTDYRNEVIITLQLTFEVTDFEFTYESLSPYLAQDKKNRLVLPSFALISGEGTCDFNIECTPAQIKKALLHYQRVVND